MKPVSDDSTSVESLARHCDDNLAVREGKAGPPSESTDMRGIEGIDCVVNVGIHATYQAQPVERLSPALVICQCDLCSGQR